MIHTLYLNGTPQEKEILIKCMQWDMHLKQQRDNSMWKRST